MKHKIKLIVSREDKHIVNLGSAITTSEGLFAIRICRTQPLVALRNLFSLKLLHFTSTLSAGPVLLVLVWQLVKKGNLSPRSGK